MTKLQLTLLFLLAGAGLVLVFLGYMDGLAFGSALAAILAIYELKEKKKSE